MKIHKHIPEAKGEIGFIQGRVPKELKDQVGAILEIEGVSWNDLLIACLKAYAEEAESLKKRRG